MTDWMDRPLAEMAEAIHDDNVSAVEIAETAVLIARSGSFDVDEDKSKISSKFTRFDLDSGLAVSSFGFQSKVTLEYGMLLVKEGRMM